MESIRHTYRWKKASFDRVFFVVVFFSHPSSVCFLVLTQGVEVVKERHQAAFRLWSKLKQEASIPLDHEALAAVRLIEVCYMCTWGYCFVSLLWRPIDSP